MPLVQTRGAASAQGFGEFAQAGAVNYIEQVFSCFLYTGTGAAQTINNGIDLSTKGGLVWLKARNVGGNHYQVDTARGNTKYLASNSTTAQMTFTDALTAFTTTGFNLGPDAAAGDINGNGYVMASWTFRKQPKFFDVVTFSTTNSANARISHNLGSVPAFYVIKRVDGAGGWFAYHGSLGRSSYLQLQSTNASASSTDCWGTSDPTTTDFGVNEQFFTNGTVGLSYIAYVFASNAGGFGLTGTDNVISCGSYTGNGSTTGPEVNIGYEPQWLLIKEATQSGNAWSLFDNMRGLSVAGPSGHLRPNASDAEDTTSVDVRPTATGFQPISSSGRVNRNGETFIYIAIRRGPMKVPTSGTSVFAPLTYTGNGTSGRYISGAGFPPDLIIQTARSASENREFDDRLRGGGSTAMNALFSNSSNAEAANSGSVQLLNQDGFTVRSFGNGSSVTYIGECFKRAPSFFDVVCYTGTGNVGSDATRITHNLGVAPELIIVKSRSNAYDWITYTANNGVNKFLLVNTTDALGTISGIWATTAPSATTFGVSNGGGSYNNGAGMTYVAYLFATCAGVSKVGSVTHSEPTTVSCGFTPRFVLLKSTENTGTNDWFVFDSARGLVPGNDPYLRLNSTGAENTPFGAADLVDVTSDGFIMNGFGGGNYIFLAIA